MSEDELTPSEEFELSKLLYEVNNPEKVAEIKKQADEFVNAMNWNKWELPCKNCHAANCVCNETCIVCGCQL